MLVSAALYPIVTLKKKKWNFFLFNIFIFLDKFINHHSCVGAKHAFLNTEEGQFGFQLWLMKQIFWRSRFKEDIFMRDLKVPFQNAVIFNQNALLLSMCLLDVLVGETIPKFL